MGLPCPAPPKWDDHDPDPEIWWEEKNSLSSKTHPHGSSNSCVPGLSEELTPANARSPPARVFLPPATVTPGAVEPRGFVSRYFSTSLFFPWELSYPCSWPNEDIVSDVPSLGICPLLCQAKNCLLPWFCLILPVFGESAVRTLNAFLTWGMYFRVWWAGCPPQSRWSL